MQGVQGQGAISNRERQITLAPEKKEEKKQQG
jgi:hypothetical protein